MKKTKRSNTQHRAAIKLAEEELRIGAKILEYEMGDIWGHVGVRLPEDEGIAVQMFRRPESGKKDWLVHFDYQLNKLGGVGTPPREAAIYTGIFKARPDVNAAVHSHAPHVRGSKPRRQTGFLRANAIGLLWPRRADLSETDLYFG